MTPEERERTMEFILQQQAQFAADLEKEHEERLQNQARDQARITRVETCVVLLTELAQIQSQRLEEYERTSNEMLARLDRILDRLADKN